MKKLIESKKTNSLTRDERGLSTVEYIIILVLIAAAAVGLWSDFGGTIQDKLTAADNEISENVNVDNN